MKIAVIGSGKIGSTMARLCVAAGHQVAIANRRGRESLRDLERELGGAAHATTVQDAAQFGDLVLVAVPFGVIDTLPPSAFAGKVVIDANNYYPNRDGHVAELDRDETTSTQLLARHLPGARVVKAFNTMNYAILGRAGDPAKPQDERLAVFVAGDDDEAKRLVMELIDELRFAAIDTGSLADGGRSQQPGAPVYARRSDRCAGSRGLELVTSVRARGSDYQLPPWQSLAGLGPAQVRCRAPLLPLDSMNASPDREWAVIT